MKKVNLLFFSVCLVAAGFFSSCKDDETTDAPDIAFTNDIESTTVSPGQSWTVTGSITSIAGLDEVKFFSVVGTTETQLGNAVTSFDDKNEYAFQYTINNITATMALKVTATDKNDKTASKNFTITVGSTAEEVTFWTGNLSAQLGAQDNTSKGSAFATTTGQVYLKTDAKTNSNLVDFIYYYGGSVNAQIMSPSYAGQAGVYESYVSGWATKNATKFGTTTLSASEFDNITKTDDAPITAAVGTITEGRAGNLAVGTVFGFQTAAGKKGLVKVTALNATASGTITIEVKVQK